MCGIPQKGSFFFWHVKTQNRDPVSNYKVITGTAKQVTRAEISTRCHGACLFGKNTYLSVILLLGGEGGARLQAGNNTALIKMVADCIQASKKTCSLAFKGTLPVSFSCTLSLTKFTLQFFFCDDIRFVLPYEPNKHPSLGSRASAGVGLHSRDNDCQNKTLHRAFLKSHRTTWRTMQVFFFWTCSESQSGALCYHWPCGWAGFPQENWPPPPRCDPSDPPAGPEHPWLFAWSGTGWSSRSTTESSSRSPPTAGDRNHQTLNLRAWGTQGWTKRASIGWKKWCINLTETVGKQPNSTSALACSASKAKSQFPLYHCHRHFNNQTLKFNVAAQFLYEVKPVHDTIN